MGLLKFSRMSDYAVVVLMHMSDRASVQTSPTIAASVGLPEPTVAKVLKIMAGAGIVASQRGARGGYRVVRSLSEVSIADVVVAIDGPVALTACVEGSTSDCQIACSCPAKGRWDMVNDAVRDALSAISLNDLRGAQPTRARHAHPIQPAAE